MKNECGPICLQLIIDMQEEICITRLSLTAFGNGSIRQNIHQDYYEEAPG
jgi:hypothetical protein